MPSDAIQRSALAEMLRAYTHPSEVTTYTTPGAHTFTAPADGTARVQLWGGGSGVTNTGASQGCAGGSGGGYSEATIAVTAGTDYAVQVGAAGVNGITVMATGDGGDTTFGTGPLVRAKGGTKSSNATTSVAVGGQAANGIGTIKFSGGNGGACPVANWAGGGGGSSAGPAANGGNGGDASGPGGGSGGVAGAAGTAPTGGGAGGIGGANGAPCGAGVAPGGGGGGGYQLTDSGASAAGKAIITFRYA